MPYQKRSGLWIRIAILLSPIAFVPSDSSAQGTPLALDERTKVAAPQANPGGAMQKMPGMSHGSMNHDDMNSAGMFLMNESSGTGFQPSAWPMPMLMTQAGHWHLMWMGQAFVVDTQQSGPRGGDKLYATNWGMFGAIHELAGGSIMLRSMLSLEPATITNRRYPLLFQTGETAYGVPLVDAQHPHDLCDGVERALCASAGRTGNMEHLLCAGRRSGNRSGGIPSSRECDGAAAGDSRPSLAGLHPYCEQRAHSRRDLRQSSAGGVRDSVDANPTKTAGTSIGAPWIPGPPGSACSPPRTGLRRFRWAVCMILKHHTPASIVRTTASLEYVRPAPGDNYWAASFVWGQNYKVEESRRTNAVLAEAVVPFRGGNLLTGRLRMVPAGRALREQPRARRAGDTPYGPACVQCERHCGGIHARYSAFPKRPDRHRLKCISLRDPGSPQTILWKPFVGRQCLHQSSIEGRRSLIQFGSVFGRVAAGRDSCTRPL